MKRTIILPKGVKITVRQVYDHCRTITVLYRGSIYNYFDHDIVYNKLAEMMKVFLVPRPQLAQDENPHNIYVENCISWEIVSSDDETNTWEMIISPTFLPELPNIIIIEI